MNTSLLSLYNAETLDELLRRHSDTIGTKRGVTISCEGKETHFTFEDLLVRGLRAAAIISQMSLQGDRVILAMPTSPEFIDFLFGCFLSGRVAVPLPVEKSTSRFSRLAGVLQDCEPTLAIFRSRADFDKMKENLNNIEVHIVDENPVTSSVRANEFTSSPQTAALIQYTSGSTSAPKGVVLSHENILANLRMIQQSMQITPEERVVSWLPLHHDMGLIGMLLSFVGSGAYTYIYPYQEFARDPMSWPNTMASVEATLSGAPTFAFDLIGKRASKISDLKLDLSKMRLLYCGSERISQTITERFYTALSETGLKPQTFFPCYGMAEASLLISGKFELPSSLNNQFGSLPTCGEIANGLSVRIVDQDGNVQPPGFTGEIEVKGPSISRGYWADLRTQIVNGKVPVNEGQWLKTGDLGFLYGAEIFVKGRQKDLIKFHGRSIYPDDIEHIIERLEEWFPSNGIVTVSPEDGVIYIVAEIQRSKRNDDMSEILRIIQGILNDNDLRCDRFVVLSPASLPKTSSGKKQRQRTLEMLQKNELKIIWDSDSDVAPTVKSARGNQEGNLPEILIPLRSYLESINVDLADERRSFPSDFLLELQKSNLLGLLIPKDLQGSGLNHSQFAAVAIGLGELDMSMAAIVGIHNTIGTFPIMHSKVLSDRDAVLKKIARGGMTAFALTESSAGSNPRGMKALAKKAGDRILLNGEKIWIGNAPFAEFISVFVKEQDENGQELGVSAFLLRKGVHAFQVGEEQLTLGVRSMPQNRLLMTDVVLTEADRLSAPGEGMSLAFLAMEYGRFGLAGVAIGAMKSAVSKAYEYAQQREIWTGLLGENAYFKFRMNEINIQRQALFEVVTYSSKQFSENFKLPAVLSLSCKILAGEWGFSAIDTCLQFTGGRGYTETFGIARIWRDVRLLRIFEGPTETVAYQLGASIARHASGTTDFFGVDHRFMSAVEILQEEFATKLSAESYYLILGIFAAKSLALRLLAESKASTNVKQGARIYQESLFEDVKVLMKKALHLQALNESNPVTSKITGKARPLFDNWTGEVLAIDGLENKKVSSPPAPTPNTRPTSMRPKSSSAVVAKSEVAAAIAEPLTHEFLNKKLEEWLTQHTRARNIDRHRPLSDYGVDSLLAYELLCFVEEEFKVVLKEQVIQQRPSIDELCAIILGRKSK